MSWQEVAEASEILGDIQEFGDPMKTTVLALFLLCVAGAAFGQASLGAATLSAEPQIIQESSHEARASQHTMAASQNLLHDGETLSAQGERPLWEVAPKPMATMPLGDVARMLRKEHATVKKAEVLWEQ